MSLDALKAELAVERKNTQNDAARPAKYMRRGELEKLKEEQERKEKEEREKRRAQSEVDAREIVAKKSLQEVSCAQVYYDNLMNMSENRPYALIQIRLYLNHQALAPRENRHLPLQNRVASTSRMKRRFGVCEQRASRYACSERLTGNGGSAFVPLNSSRRRATSGMEGRTILEKRWKM